MDFANKEQIKYVIIIGEDEIKKEEFALKNMETGEEVIIVKNRLKEIVERCL